MTGVRGAERSSIFLRSVSSALGLMSDGWGTVYGGIRRRIGFARMLGSMPASCRLEGMTAQVVHGPAGAALEARVLCAISVAFGSERERWPPCPPLSTHAATQSAGADFG